MNKKNSYADIIIYTVAILLIIYLYQVKLISYDKLSILLTICLAGFVLYNFRHKIKGLIDRIKNS